jgi:large subunit ribosomal protein L6e
MSATPGHTKKTFGKSTRDVPHHSVKAKKWYPTEDDVVAKKVGSIIMQRDWDV